nr:response regulator transcription factor [Pontiella sulfatireligans]
MVEDNALFSQTLGKMIQLSNNMSCTASFSNAEDCQKSLKSGALSETDLVLLDLQLPGQNGLTLVPILKLARPTINILVLTQNHDYLTTLEAIRLGVSGYILKTATISEIRAAIQDVHAGGCVIDPQLSRLVLAALNSNNFEGKNPLSEREKQVLEFMAMGYVKKEVSDKLNISYSAVACYTERIYTKLQVPNITAAVAAAIRKGLI